MPTCRRRGLFQQLNRLFPAVDPVFRILECPLVRSDPICQSVGWLEQAPRPAGLAPRPVSDSVEEVDEVTSDLLGERARDFAQTSAHGSVAQRIQLDADCVGSSRFENVSRRGCWFLSFFTISKLTDPRRAMLSTTGSRQKVEVNAMAEPGCVPAVARSSSEKSSRRS